MKHRFVKKLTFMEGIMKIFILLLLINSHLAFGETLTSGDLNGDSIDDLVIGVPRENISKGAFHILFGSDNGITTNDSLFEKNLEDGEDLDEMGYAMTIADFGIGTELVVGIPGDDSSVSSFNDAGSVEVFEFPQPLPDMMFSDSFEE